MLLLWENSPLGNEETPSAHSCGMENAVGGGETPRLWGGKQQALFVASTWLLFVGLVVSLAPGSAVLRVSLPRSKGCSRLWGSFG